MTHRMARRIRARLGAELSGDALIVLLLAALLLLALIVLLLLALIIWRRCLWASDCAVAARNQAPVSSRKLN